MSERRHTLNINVRPDAPAPSELPSALFKTPIRPAPRYGFLRPRRERLTDVVRKIQRDGILASLTRWRTAVQRWVWVDSASLLADDKLDSPDGSSKTRRSLSKPALIVLALLFLIGMFELRSYRPGHLSTTSQGTTLIKSVKKDPFAILAQAKVPVPIEQSKQTPQTTAVLLNYARPENLRPILAHLCQFTSIFSQVLIWNNGPPLSPSYFESSKCPPHMLAIMNSPGNQLFLGRYLACAATESKYCFFQDDDWIVGALEPAYQTFLRNTDELVVTTNVEVSILERWEWCFSNTPYDLHTCFAWVGTGAFTSRSSVEQFLSDISSDSKFSAWSADELAMADNAFSTWRNKPPVVLSGKMWSLPDGKGHSSGQDGRLRNKEFFQRALNRLTTHLGVPSSTKPLLPVQPKVPLLSLFKEHNDARHMTDRVVYLTNIELLPAISSVTYNPRFNNSVTEWENALGYVGRGWTEAVEGGEVFEKGERWMVAHGYDKATDGNWNTAFRSNDVIRRDDYVGLDILYPLENPSGTITLAFSLQQLPELLNSLAVEVMDSSNTWLHVVNSLSELPASKITCSPTKHRATIQNPIFPTTFLTSKEAHAMIKAQKHKRSWALGIEKLTECKVQIARSVYEGRGWSKIRLRATRDNLDLGWNVYKLELEL